MKWRDKYSIEILMAKIALLAFVLLVASFAVGYLVFIQFDK